MDDQINCNKLYQELSRIKEKRVEFGQVYEEGLKKRIFDDCRPLFREIRNLLDGPETEIGRLRAMDVASELNHLKLKEQYESQVDVAWKSGLFGVNKRGRGGEKKEAQKAKSDVPLIERGGKKYPMPNWREVRQTLRKPENLEIIREKSAQGFTKMLIVPFGYDLKTMAGKFKEKVRELDQSGLNPDGSSNPHKGIFGAGGEKVEFNRDEAYYPVWIWEGLDESQLVYYPKKYYEHSHGGISKEDAIKINGAWQICFVEDMPVIPEEGEETGGRKQIDRKGSCMKGQSEIPEIQQFHAAMQDKGKMENPAKYRHEKGQTPELYFWMQLTSLLGREKSVLLDYENNNEYRGTYLTECYNISSLGVPLASWLQFRRQFNQHRRYPDFQDDRYGVRASVNIK